MAEQSVTPFVERAPMIVLQSYADPARSGFMNPYKVSLADSLPREEVRVEYFRWRTALASRFDLLHVHWPEHMVRGSSRPRQLAKTLALALLLLRLRVQKKAIVRTVHNVSPHEATNSAQRWLLERLDSMTSVWVIMNDTTPTPDPTRTVLIPHGHYRDWHRPHPDLNPRPGRLLTFGHIRQYKGVEELLRVFRGMPESEGLSLTVAGRPDSAVTGDQIVRLAGSDPRIRVDLRFLDAAELTADIQKAEIVVLPYRDMHNSGSVLLALSLNRPLIVPSTLATENLAEEFGDEWVITYQGELNGSTLATAIDTVRARTRTGEGVDMSTRDWSVLGAQLAAVYRDASSRQRSRPASRPTKASTSL